MCVLIMHIRIKNYKFLANCNIEILRFVAVKTLIIRDNK